MFGFLDKKTKREIMVNAERLEVRVAILEEGRLEDFQIEHPTKTRCVGNIYKGRIQNLEHDLQAAFVDIGLAKNAFLHYWDMVPENVNLTDIDDNARRKKRSRQRFTNKDIERQFPPGSDLVVQVTKGPIGTKGPRVTASISLPGRYLVMMPGADLTGVSRKIEDGKERQRLKKILARLPVPEGVGLIVRTVASKAANRSLARDLRGLITTWSELQQKLQESRAPACLYQEPALVERVVRDWVTEEIDRIVIDNEEEFERLRDVVGQISRRARGKVSLYKGELPLFDHFGIEQQIEQAFRRKVNLPGGGYVVLDETEALIAIDVNTGRHKGKGSQEDAILEVNMEAVDEVARQLRLRNIGGLVVIDLIDMKSRKHQAAVYRRMRELLERDRSRTNVLQISDLGIMEMTRQRAEESVLSTMYSDCPYCRGRGNVKSPLSMSVDIQRQLSAILRRSGKAHPREVVVVVHPTVLERLKREDEEFLVELRDKFEGKLSFRGDPARHVEFFCILDHETQEVLYTNVDR